MVRPVFEPLFQPVLTADITSLRAGAGSVAKLLESFGTIGQWTVGGAGAAQAADAWNIDGNPSVKLTTGTAASGNATTTKTTAALDVHNGGVMVLAVNLPDVNARNQGVTLYLSSANFSGSKWINSTSTIHPGGFSKGVNLVPINLADMAVSGGESLANLMTTIRARIDSDSGDGVAMFDGLVLGAKDRPRIVLGFDDGFVSQYATAYPYMASKGMVGTIYAVQDLNGTANYMTLANAQEMYAAGWDIANHTKAHLGFASKVPAGICASQTPTAGALTINGSLAAGGSVTLDAPRHITITANGANEYTKRFTITGELAGQVVSETIGGPPNGSTYNTDQLFDKVTGVSISANASGAITVGTAVTTAEAQAAIESVTSWLVSNGMPRAALHFAYPRGENTPSSDTAIANAGILTARTTANAPEVTYFGHIRPTRLPGRPVRALAVMKAYVDTAIATGTTCHLFFHKIVAVVVDSGLDCLEQDFKDIIDYIATKRDAGLIDVQTITQWYDAVQAGRHNYPQV
ncbi:polysaccharide deacetylase family protein [Pararhizobium sp. O133]|uniref:polysaccharide deacetylase family protein n=1 Tax=Pararhizobium sp. O133 TaxID=3449278 RepID=UPI003F682630